MNSKAVSERELYGTPKVGGDALAYCTRCKMELAHVIVSMMSGRPAKVICKTCRSQHNYKSGVKAAPRASKTGSTRVERTEVRASEYWEKRLSEHPSKDPKPYRIQETFVKGDVVQHAQFGLGIVEEVRGNQKILVLFRVGDKVLVHSMSPSAQS